MANEILVVEDDPHDLEFTLLALRKCDLPNPIVVVRDGAEAIDYLLHQNKYADCPPGVPFLILLDLRLPKVDGPQVLRIIQEQAQFDLVRIIVLTDSALDTEFRRKSLERCDSYIAKTFDLDLFRHEICKAISELNTR